MIDQYDPMFDTDVTSATHKALYHIRDPTTYTYFKRHAKGHWLYFTHEPSRRWEASGNGKLWWDDNLVEIDEDEFTKQVEEVDGA